MGKRLREILSQIIPSDELIHIYNSYDIVGDIAILRLGDASKRYWHAIAESIMSIHKNVKTVLTQVSPVCGTFRTRKLEYVAGENKAKTIHKESSCLFAVDVKECYFSPRLLHERMRIAKQVGEGETIVNMFAGVGCFSIIIAKHSKAKKVYSIDVNPIAIRYMRENVRLNMVYGKVIPMEGDAKEIIKEKLCNSANRILMPLPEKAFDYLPYALLALEKSKGWIHYYDFEHSRKNENPIEKVKFKVAEKLKSLDVTFDFPFGRIVRTIGPNWFQIVLDIFIKG